MNGGIRWEKRWWFVCAAAVVLAGLLLAAKGRGEAKGPGMPFRLGRVQDGVVIKKGVEPGDTITSGVSSYNAGTAIVTVADLKSLIVRVNLNEVDIGKVQVGQPARVTLDAHPQQTFTGKVRFVAPAAELVEKIKVFRLEVGLDRLEDCFRS